MGFSQRNINYSDKDKYKNTKFWYRFGGKPSFDNKAVLDIGCGLGCLCVDIAKSGAKKVVGIDINQKRIDLAKLYVNNAFPQLNKKIEFRCTDLKNYKKEVLFDIIVSKETFEHIIDLGGGSARSKKTPPKRRKNLCRLWSPME